GGGGGGGWGGWGMGGGGGGWGGAWAPGLGGRSLRVGPRRDRGGPPRPRRAPRGLVSARGEPLARVVARARPHPARHGGDAAPLAGPGRPRQGGVHGVGRIGDRDDPAGPRRRGRALVGGPGGDAPDPHPPRLQPPQHRAPA